jgi:uncharacterized protein with NAD-binding domain and iron-sulfur cluster
VLLGYYDHTFDVMRRCYEELDRPTSDPDCPIRSLDDAVTPSHLAGVVDQHDGTWSPWVASFSATPGRPGDASPDLEGPMPWAVADLVSRSLQLLLDFFGSLSTATRAPGGSVRLSTSAVPPRRPPSGAGEAMAAVVQGAGLIGLTLPLSWAQRLRDLARTSPFGLQLEQALPAVIEPIRDGLRKAVLSRPGSRRTYQLIELVTANLAGVVADGLLTRPEGYGAIDHLDYRDWLAAHGIDPEALESPILRGMYDLVFGYEGADPARPRFSAGLGLQLATKMLMGYRGALFWKMQAGMGEVIFAPLYQVLRDRGVEFRFFHRVDALHLSEDGRSIAAIELGIQSDLAQGVTDYDPLIRVKGLPCWPSVPLDDQLRSSSAGADVDLESFWSLRQDAGRRTLEVGREFDVVVFGISLGMVRHVCPELLEQSPAWRSMVDRLGTVATQSLQVWLNEDEAALGWTGPGGATISGFVKPFDTWASMSHLLPAEDWPTSDAPRTIAYFCSALAAPDPATGGVDTERERDAVRGRAREFLDHHVGTLWPAAVDDHGFDWSLLADGGSSATAGANRLDDQYWRANIDPSDLYVQSLPGTDRYRMKPGSTGFDNLVVAGDWTDSGLNAGCVEAATRSGRLAAQAVHRLVTGAREGSPP